MVGLNRADVIATHFGNVKMKAYEVIDYNDNETKMLKALVGKKLIFDVTSS